MTDLILTDNFISQRGESETNANIKSEEKKGQMLFFLLIPRHLSPCEIWFLNKYKMIIDKDKLLSVMEDKLQLINIK